jgi:signal transduction histidine kinase
MAAVDHLKVLLTVMIKSETDVLLARRRARQIALLLGFTSQDQVKISTAVSEIVRNAHAHAGGGKVDFCLSDKRPPFTFTIMVKDTGGGIKDIDLVLDEKSEHAGLKGAKRLVNSMVVETSGKGTSVRLDKHLVLRSLPFSPSEIDDLANSLTKLATTSTLDEVHQQNQELLVALEQLSRQQSIVNDLNSELQSKNSEMERLYSEMQLLNDSLEQKVSERTHQLASARDEAIRANELKSQFVANISHEIRTPMSGILGLSELVLMESEGELKETAEHIHAAATNLMTLVGELLDMSKLEAGKMDIIKQPFAIGDLVNDVINGFGGSAAEKKLTLKADLNANLEKNVLGAGDRIRQVLGNLVQNAIKFTDDGSVLIIVEEQKREGNTAYIRFSVKDTGLGISEENQKKLFKLFVQVDGSTTRRQGGTGLGLALSKKLVELMEGFIAVDSTEGQGSTFWFTIPLQVGVGVHV